MSNRPRSPLEVDDLLSEILLRLPPQPSSLPCVSAVCKRWRILVSNPRFVRRFRLHHCTNPPLLGFFSCEKFVPTMEPPNRVPEGCISLQPNDDFLITLGCNHGLVLFGHELLHEVLVWDPVINIKYHLVVPPLFKAKSGQDDCRPLFSGAVLRAVGDIKHFQVVLVRTVRNEQQHRRAIAYVYSSLTGVWGEPISRALPSMDSHLTNLTHQSFPVLVGNSLHWSLFASPPGILEFDLDKQILSVIPVPVEFSVMRADGGGLGFLFMSLSDFTAQLWKRITNCDGVSSWVLGMTIKLDQLLSLDPEKETEFLEILGFAEENNVVFLLTAIRVFMINLKSLQWKKISETASRFHYHPFECVYTAGMGIDDGNDGAELLHNT